MLIKGQYSADVGRANAKTLQALIDDTSKKGGGIVTIEDGFYAMAPIVLKDGVTLHLNKGVILKFTKAKEDYPLIVTNYEGETAIRTVSPISAEGASNIAITGQGFIDGSGELWRPIKQFKTTQRQWDALLKSGGHVIEAKDRAWLPTLSAYEGMIKNIQDTSEEGLKEASEYWDFYRPVMVSLKHCKNVLLKDVTFTNSPAWCLHPFFCENVEIDSINVKNPYYAQNGDGLDIESCKNVYVHDSIFETGDDAICLKAGKNAEARKIIGPCENIHIANCTVYQGHGGFVVGSEMSRGVQNVYVHDCNFIGTDVGVRFKSALGRGGIVQNVKIDNIKMVDIKNEAIILTMGYVLNRVNNDEENVMESLEDIPYFKNISMTGMQFLGQKDKIKIEPIEGRPETITNIVVNGIRYDGPTVVK
ncbi:MAG: glycoside hydrolase family 28 protein [Sphaerochaetaceae bacterium]|nr:glycoside hydrolase family 28 protein [Sphaerochaetaceae bacterium]